MAVTAVCVQQVTYSGDEVDSSNVIRKSNTNSNAVTTGSYYVSLSSGFNSVTVPTGFTVNGVTIIPPSGNTTSITLKGITGDTGIRIHNTAATSIALDSSVTAVGITAGSAMTVRLAWW